MRLQLVKLGGGLIAPKGWAAHTADVKTIRRLGKEVKEFKGALIIGHGMGNFAHREAAQYRTHQGFINTESKFGACVTQDVAGRINRIVVEELLKLGLPVGSISAHDIWVARNGRMIDGAYRSVELMLKERLIPVVYGDVIWDERQGCTIFSTEVCLSLLARELKAGRIIQVSSEEGVLDGERKVIKEINPSNFDQLKQSIGGAVGVDVTGGMLHKVEESLELAKDLRIETLIISGKVRGRLTAALRGEEVLGTRIRG